MSASAAKRAATDAPRVPGDFTPPGEAIARVERRALVVGTVALVVGVIGGVLDPAQFFRSYLVAFVFCLGVPLGCFGVAMLHHVSSGAWGLMIRRILEAAARTLPWMALFFVPLLLGVKKLYPWADPALVARDALLRHQSSYLNVPFFAVRALLYFAIWSTLALVLDRLSRRQDATGDPGLSRRMRLVSAVGLGLFCLCGTFASIDWLMSLDPHWSSTIYGFYVVGGHVVSAFAFIVLIGLFLARRRPMDGVLRPVHFHDYGKLMLAFVVLWAYFAASQLIIMYQGNIAEEVAWYRGRLLGGWFPVTVLLFALHFALPFLLLLSRDLKRNVRRLAIVAGLLLFMRWVDVYWLAAPAFSPDHPRVHWLDFVLPFALGGVWVGLFARQLRKHPLLPVGAPGLAEALGHD